MESNRVYHDSRNSEKKERNRLRKDLLVLIVHELISEGFFEAAESVESKATWSLGDFEPCDNVDLSLVLLDFIAYYQVRFERRPQLVRSKRITSEVKQQNIAKKSAVPPKRLPEKKRLDSSLIDEEALDLNVPKSLLLNGEMRDLAQMILADTMKTSSKRLDWIDVVGHEAPKRVLEEHVVCPLKFPEAFFSLPKSTGVLLYGPSGTGKTHLVRVLASKVQGIATFFNLKVSSFASKWRGESEKLMRVVFDIASANSPCVVFMDEVDAILGDRGVVNEHEASKRAKAEFLIQMDGLTSEGDVIVVAATNLPWSLDPAVLRRFPEQVYVGLPASEAERASLIQMNLKTLKSLPPKVMPELLNRCEGLSGSQIAQTLVSSQRSLITQSLIPGSETKNLETLICQSLINKSGQRGTENEFKKWMMKS